MSIDKWRCVALPAASLFLAALVGTSLVVGSGVAAGTQAASTWPALYHDSAGTNFNPSETAISPSNVGHLHQVWYMIGNTAVVTPEGIFDSIDDGPQPQGEYFQVVRADTATGRSYTAFTYSTEYLPAMEPEPMAYASESLLVDGPAPPGLKALSATTGQPRWRHPDLTTHQGQIGQVNLAVRGSNVYVANGGCMQACGRISAVALGTGRIAWQHTGRGVSGAEVIVAGQRVYTGGTSGTNVYDVHTGALHYTVPWAGLWTANSRRAFVLAETLGTRVLWPVQMIAVDASGKRLWSASVGKIGQSAQPVLAYGTLFTVANRFHPGVTAFDASSGRVRWSVNLGPNLALAAANHLLFALHADNGTLDALDTGTGRILAHITVRGWNYAGSTPAPAELAIAGGTVYVAGRGRIRAFRP